MVGNHIESVYCILRYVIFGLSKMRKTKLKKLFLKKRGISQVISTTILAGAVIALGFVVFTWTYNRSLAFNREYANVVETDLARIKEKLVFEFAFYNTSDKELTVYMINCGKSNNVSLTNAFLSNSSWYQSFTNIELTLLNETSVESLDVNEEGCLKITVDLVVQSSYSIRVVTGRGRAFETTFVA